VVKRADGMSDMTRVLILLTLPEEVTAQYRDRLRAAFPEIAVDIVAHHREAEAMIGRAQVLMTFGPMLTHAVIAQAANLRWIQALGTGVDNIEDLPSLKREVVITNIRGIHGAAVSEAAIMAMLALARDLPRALRNQARQAWERWPARLLDGKTAAIVGVGLIAAELAPRLKALGMMVIGLTSAVRPVAGFDRMHHRDELRAVAGDVDFLVLLTPHSPETSGLVGADVLAAMKPSSYLVNLARGGVVDEDALIAALETGRIAGAALDVFSAEPLPAGHRLWSTRNVIVTPHAGGFYDDYPARAWPVIEHNMRCFLAGDYAGMMNRVER
jgi:D-2-hydroxyacid dehydrogenase (NADP+)